MDKYILKYEEHFNDGSVFKDKEIKINNCLSELHAKVKLEQYLKKKHSNFNKLVITSCRKDIMGNFNDVFGNFKDIFGM
jgi:hypothetical protein